MGIDSPEQKQSPEDDEGSNRKAKHTVEVAAAPFHPVRGHVQIHAKRVLNHCMAVTVLSIVQYRGDHADVAHLMGARTASLRVCRVSLDAAGACICKGPVAG